MTGSNSELQRETPRTQSESIVDLTPNRRTLFSGFTVSETVQPSNKQRIHSVQTSTLSKSRPYHRDTPTILGSGRYPILETGVPSSTDELEVGRVDTSRSSFFFPCHFFSVSRTQSSENFSTGSSTMYC